MGGHVARMGARRDAYKVLVVKPDRKRPLGRPRHRRKGVLKRVFKQWYGRHGRGRSGSELGQVVCFCECGNEPLVTLKYREFLD